MSSEGEGEGDGTAGRGRKTGGGMAGGCDCRPNIRTFIQLDEAREEGRDSCRLWQELRDLPAVGTLRKTRGTLKSGVLHGLLSSTSGVVPPQPKTAC
mmetsp:Transcript_66690/g.159446  ORF Transcript_66690/g.159446 Transcript_66690/m.159446 type:complete len:97 (-) Transcript_66690:1716-2006(-)